VQKAENAKEGSPKLRHFAVGKQNTICIMLLHIGETREAGCGMATQRDEVAAGVKKLFVGTGVKKRGFWSGSVFTGEIPERNSSQTQREGGGVSKGIPGITQGIKLGFSKEEPLFTKSRANSSRSRCSVNKGLMTGKIGTHDAGEGREKGRKQGAKGG